MVTLVTRKGGNRHALNKLYREQEKIRTETWIAQHLQEEKPALTEDPYTAALKRMAEDNDIAERRAAFPLH